MVTVGFFLPVSPWLIYAAAAAAMSIPIAIHFFFRSRYRNVPWGAMKFILAAIEQTSTRIKFQELLLLCLRCLLVAILVLAVARPRSQSQRGSGAGDAVDAVFVFDTSYSMTVKEGQRTRFKRAQDAAVKIIDKLPYHSTVQIIAGAQKAELVGPAAPENLAAAKQLVLDLKIQHQPADLSAHFEKARAVLSKNQASNKELYLFSDLQISGFEDQLPALRRDLEELKKQAHIVFVQSSDAGASQAPFNLTIDGITPQSGIPRPNRKTTFAVVVRNTGRDTDKKTDAVPRKGSIKLFVGDQEAKTAPAPLRALAPGQKEVVTLSAEFPSTGLHVVTALLEGDDLEGDNRFDFVVNVREQVKLLIVDGNFHRDLPEKSSSFNLYNALLPVRESQILLPEVVSAERAAPDLIKQYQVVFLVNVGMPSKEKFATDASMISTQFLDELAEAVRAGKSLVIIPGPNTKPAAYNESLGKLGLLPMPLDQFVHRDRKKKEPSLAFNRQSLSLPSFRFMREEKAYSPLESYIDIWKWFTVKEPVAQDKKGDAESVWMRFGNNDPAVIAKRVGEGEVVLLTTSAHGEPPVGDRENLWNNWSNPVVSVAFIPFWDVLVNYLINSRLPDVNLSAGQTLVHLPTSSEALYYSLRTPDKEMIRLPQPSAKDPAQKNSPRVVRASGLTRAGIYRVISWKASDNEPTKDLDSTGTPTAVVPDARDTVNLTTATAEDLEKMLGFAPKVLAIERALEGNLESVTSHREWTEWFLLAALIVAMTESLLAWVCGRAW